MGIVEEITLNVTGSVAVNATEIIEKINL